MKAVRMKDGSQMALSDYQRMKNLNSRWMAPNFSVAELSCGGEVLMSEYMLEFAQALRERLGRPIKINSGYRTEAKQKQLKESRGSLAASFSPHVVGMAMDFDTTSKSDTASVLAEMKIVARNLGLSLRYGWQQYQRAGNTFIHVDCCPMYYAKGKPFHGKQHPEVWEKGGKEW